MKNCSLNQSAEKIVAGLTALLDGERIRREIDVPLDRVLEAFAIDPHAPHTQAAFNETLGRFMHEICLHGLRLKRDLNPAESLAEALFILRDYSGQGTEGYQIAIYDAFQDEDRCGVRRILEWIAQTVKQTEKRSYIDWVLVASWDSFDWTTKCQVTAYILETLGPFLPPFFREKPVAQLADDWRVVLTLYLDSEALLKRLDASNTLIPDLRNTAA